MRKAVYTGHWLTLIFRAHGSRQYPNPEQVKIPSSVHRSPNLLESGYIPFRDSVAVGQFNRRPHIDLLTLQPSRERHEFSNTALQTRFQPWCELLPLAGSYHRQELLRQPPCCKQLTVLLQCLQHRLLLCSSVASFASNNQASD